MVDISGLFLRRRPPSFSSAKAKLEHRDTHSGDRYLQSRKVLVLYTSCSGGRENDSQALPEGLIVGLSRLQEVETLVWTICGLVACCGRRPKSNKG